MTTSPVSSVEVVGLTYRIGSATIVSDVGLSVGSGEVVGLIGPNGAGKTTLLDLLSGFSMAQEGRVTVNGRDMSRWPPNRRTHGGLARTFQESPAVPGLTVFEHLQLAVEATPHERRRAVSLSAEDLVTRLHLGAIRNMMGAEMPTIQRRLLDFARAIGTCPNVLLLDEPFAGLGSTEVSLLVEEIERLKASGTAVIVVEHRLGILNQVASTVVALVNGSRVAAGGLEEVLSTPVVREAFLGVAANKSREHGG